MYPVLPQPLPKGIAQMQKPKKIRKLFSAEEDALLSHIMFEQTFTTWIAVAAQIPGRSARQCRDRWANYLSPENKNGPWTPEEDEQLAEKYAELGPQWTTIAKYFDGRSENNVKNRWYTHLKNKFTPPAPQPVAKTPEPTNPFANLPFEIGDLKIPKLKEIHNKPTGRTPLPPISTLEVNTPRPIVPHLMTTTKARCVSAQPFAMYKRWE